MKLNTFNSNLFVLEKLMLWDCWVLSIKEMLNEKDLFGRPPANEFWCNFDFSFFIFPALWVFFHIISNSFGVLKFSLLISATCFALGTLVCLF